MLVSYAFLLQLSVDTDFSPNAICPPSFRRQAEGHSFRLSVLSYVRHSVPIYKNVPCVCNCSYSFVPILLKLFRCLDHAFKMYIFDGYNPQINFDVFFAFRT